MTAAEWFFLAGNKEAGPFTREQMHSLLGVASIHHDTLVWRPGRADWAPLSAFAEFNGLPSRPAPPVARQSADDGGAREMAYEDSPAYRQDGPPALMMANEWVDEAPHPWRRYVARLLDNVIWGSLLLFIVLFLVAFLDPDLGRTIGTWFEGRGGQAGATVLMHLVAILPNAFLIGLTGGNLGKWLCGVCVLDKTGRPIGLARAFRREANVFVVGLGFALPIISLFTMIASYQTLKRDKTTSWDKKLNLGIVHRKTGPAQYAGFTIGIVLLVGLLLSFLALDYYLAEV